MRNQIEGKFGQGKNGYDMRKIRARLAATTESWISAIFFVMNLVRYLPLISLKFLTDQTTSNMNWSAMRRLKNRMLHNYFQG